MDTNNLQVSFFNVPEGSHRQYADIDFGSFNEIQVTYENLKGWRDGNFTTLATFNTEADVWELAPEVTPTGQPNTFTDYLISAKAQA